MEEDVDEEAEAGGTKASLGGVGFAASVDPGGGGCELLVLLPSSMVGACVCLHVCVSGGEGAIGGSEEVDDEYQARKYDVCALSRQHQDRNTPANSL